MASFVFEELCSHPPRCHSTAELFGIDIAIVLFPSLPRETNIILTSKFGFVNSFLIKTDPVGKKEPPSRGLCMSLSVLYWRHKISAGYSLFGSSSAGSGFGGGGGGGGGGVGAGAYFWERPIMIWINPMMVRRILAQDAPPPAQAKIITNRPNIT
jgi:hypothetical protein